MAVALNSMVVSDAPDATRPLALASSWFEVELVLGCFAQEVEALESFELLGSPIHAFFAVAGI